MPFVLSSGSWDPIERYAEHIRKSHPELPIELLKLAVWIKFNSRGEVDRFMTSSGKHVVISLAPTRLDTYAYLQYSKFTLQFDRARYIKDRVAARFAGRENVSYGEFRAIVNDHNEFAWDPEDYVEYERAAALTHLVCSPRTMQAVNNTYNGAKWDQFCEEVSAVCCVDHETEIPISEQLKKKYSRYRQ